MDKAPNEPSVTPFDYEGSIGRLEEIVALLEDHDTRLDDAMQLYEEGVAIANSCMQKLKAAELRITELRVGDGVGDDDE